MELFNDSGGANSLPFYPQRVSPETFSGQESARRLTQSSPNTISDSELESSLDYNSPGCSSTESEVIDIIKRHRKINFQKKRKEKVIHYGLIYLCLFFLCVCSVGKEQKNGIV